MDTDELMAVQDPRRRPVRTLSPTIESYHWFRTFLGTFNGDTAQEITIADLQQALNGSNATDILKEFLNISREQGRNVFTINECLGVLHAKEFLKAKPLLKRVLGFSTIIVVAKQKRRSAIIEKVSSLTSCSNENLDDPMGVLRSYGLICIHQTPMFIIGISAVQMAVFAYNCVYPSCVQPRNVCQLPCNSSLIFSPLKRRELWRFLSYALVHDGLLHMGSNIILQLAFGLPLEMVHSWWRVMIVYCSGVQCGPLAQFFFNPHVYLAGSSSGVYALQTAHLAHIVTNFRDMEFVWMRLLGLLFIYGNDLYWVLTGPQRRQGRYFSYAGHYGGALAGLLVGVPALKTVPLGKWARYLEHGILSVFCTALWAVMFWNAFGIS
ncbi:protein rhomboid-like [Ixodes scapularis]|uniref:protein rhomboid-like n=1 Tax=Ixodes scapularis TaxID=6945 RepID=UPI001A9F84F7|nr:protein rhomboid-like [Ixodes scapularis]